MQRITRDPVILDFVHLADESKERDLEAALLRDIERFTLALGEGWGTTLTGEPMPDVAAAVRRSRAIR